MRMLTSSLLCCLPIAVAPSASAELIAHWTFDTSAADVSGNNLNGTLNNGAAAGVSDAARSTGVLSLDGVDDYVSVSDNNLLDLGGQFTITAWFKTDTPNVGAQHLIRKIGQVSGQSEIYYLRLDPGGTPVKFNVTDNAGTRSNLTTPFPPASLDPTKWYFVAATFDASGNQQSLFLDDINTPLATSTTGISGPAATTDELRIGRGDPSGYFNGLIDDVRIYDTVLSSSELDDVAMGLVIDPPPPSSLPGDFNGDFVVDQADFDVWQAGLGTTYVYGDLEVWQLNLGASAALTQPGTNVPEPGSAALLASVAGLLLGRRRRGSNTDAETKTICKRPARAKGLTTMALLAAAGLGTATHAADQPNIVFIVSDDHHWSDYSYTGENEWVQTPNIDRLATEGQLFQRGYVPMSLCRPSLVTMLTGLYAVQNGTTGNDPNTRRDADPLGISPGYPNSVDNRIMRRNIQHEATLPRMLTDIGYQTLQTGKLWEGDYQRSGFTDGYVTDSNRHQDNIAIGRGGNGQLSDVSEVTDFIDQAVAADDPFFAFYAPFLPHTPHNPPGAFRDRYNAFVSAGDMTTHEANYYAMVDWLDHSVGKIRSHIEGKTDNQGNSVDDNTIYVYAVDNGWEQSPNGPTEPGGEGKRSPDEAGVRTPIMISWQGQIFDARTLEAKLADTTLASTVDLAPTLLNIVGLEATEKMEGVNLLTQERGKVFGDIFDHDQNIYVNGEYRVGDTTDTLLWRWMIEDEWKLILPKNGSPELYNVINDPDGNTNLANASVENQQRVALMTQEIEAWWATKAPVTLYDHEFNGNAVNIDGFDPDVIDASLAAATWEVGPQAILDDGTINGRSTAVLPFTPEDDSRYELRVGLAPVATNNSEAWLSFGFQETTDATADPAENGVAWVRLRRDASLDDLVLHVAPDGDPDWTAQPFSTDEITYYDDVVPITLILDTRDNDAALAGVQWGLELVVDGRLLHEFIFTDGNPDIDGINLGSYTLPGDPAVAGWIDYIQLLDIPTEQYSILAPVLGDADNDGDVDDTDLGIAISNFTGPVGAAGGKTAAQGDTDGDGDVDDTDLGVAISGFTGPLSPASVPEPAAAVLLGVSGLLVGLRRRRALA